MIEYHPQALKEHARLQVNRTHQVPRRMNEKRPTPGHILLKTGTPGGTRRF